MKIKRSLIVLIILILSAGVYTALCFFADTSRMLPKTTVNDTDISNITLTEASDALKKEAAIRSKDSVFTVSYNGTDYALSAGAALELDYDATAKKVLKKSQTDFFARGITWIRAHLSGNPNPSLNDDWFTIELQVMCSMNNVNLYDHCIYASDADIYSYFENGRIDEIKKNYSFKEIVDRQIKNTMNEKADKKQI